MKIRIGIPSFALDEVVFEHRNKAYGAYCLRKSYPVNMGRALLSSIALFAALFLMVDYGNRISALSVANSIDENIYRINEVNITPVIEKTRIVRQRDAATPVKASTSSGFSNPKIVNDEIPQESIRSENAVESTNGVIQDLNNDDGTIGNLVTAENSFGTGTGKLSDNEEEKIHTIVDVSPQFEGGSEALRKFLIKETRYPGLASENHISGRVVAEFVINKKGEIGSIKILRGIGGGCDEEVIRVINKMPKWSPGIHQGKSVNVKMILPFSFQIN